ncbi:hypothetical protein HXX76_007456 [Chlamydomonas incerta]|uniref:CSD domain-containing protein n=1 Tax=Chlamydomonas incerta TaxID=51695 RepID=A0A835SY83_CHLIN|nr:hypothetical protein HXX76_007456 [Chlamydomonas incerta]|eukprot:KAG2435384.1 hypothetical protein HXX76_007456 [Chlamydomonas incerta]
MDGCGGPVAAPNGVKPEPEPEPEPGVISSVRKGFGFIATPSRSRDIFFHMSALEDCVPEQLQEGTAVTFVPRCDSDTGASSGAGASTAGSSDAAGTPGVAGAGGGGGRGRGQRPLATRVRLAPVGTRVRMARVEPGLVLGFVSDPASPAAAAAAAGAGATASRPGGGSSSGGGAVGAGGGPKGIIRFLGESGSPEHVFYSAEDVDAAAAAAGTGTGAAGQPAAAEVAAQRPGGSGTGAGAAATPQAALPHRGQLVLFRLCTDLRAAAQAAEQAAAAAARAHQASHAAQHQQQEPPPQARGAASAPAPRRAAYQRAVEVRLAGAAEVAAHPGWRQQAVVLQLLAGAVQSTNNIPFEISDLVVSPTLDQLGFPAVSMCVTTASATCKKGAFCCGMDFAKVELRCHTGPLAPEALGRWLLRRWAAGS